MGDFLATYSIAFVLQVVLCYFGLLVWVGKVNPFIFTRKMFPALITAFATTTSSAYTAGEPEVCQEHGRRCRNG